MYLCRCAIQVLGDAFSSIVFNYTYGYVPKTDSSDIIALSEEDAIFGVQFNTGFTVLKTSHFTGEFRKS